MASKGPRSKLDHETRARRQKIGFSYAISLFASDVYLVYTCPGGLAEGFKWVWGRFQALEAPREPRRPKTHWDHVLDEMVWLSKDFESERKWKLAQAKKVALRASKGMLDQATRGEKRVKEEEQRLRKVALTISKDVLYKHQMELDEKKKKALDKQLEFLLGQTERYSTMLAENLADTYQPTQQYLPKERCSIQYKEVDDPGFKEVPQSGIADVDEDYDMQSEEELASKREKGRANTNHPNNNQTTPPLENWTVLDGKDQKTTNTNTKRNT
ncbi:Protein PHOTOPERIOD-INDEPENDENT EARLY FLOWERING 1 [Vitis vinifera]|uniref:protein PHOTOPERIOD-INDEPENDENT Early FLOWERING 1 n=1 Tax=Vitis vinifera TaxID=29760 RepID=A0A438D5R2_VITVI|nr:Protein photoperiod-independent early flowering 1 [Vitis vinifera]RVW81423.1 Protein PHOTOPERIOD-INDEPENDENT EARLY FLOWERING 1 [Vitis vinifera]